MMKFLIQKILERGIQILELIRDKTLEPKIVLRKEFAHIQFGKEALQKLLNDYEFTSVLDIGSGAGLHSEQFLKHGKELTALDYGDSVYFRENRNEIHNIIADFNEYQFNTEFDCIWCSHVLEHQLNPHNFLKRVNLVCREGGTVAIVVPPRKDIIVGGHVALWNPGLLLYHLVLAGFDCSKASILKKGYNISVIIRKRTITTDLNLSYDRGDIRKIKCFLPDGLDFHTGNPLDDPYNGIIYSLNW